MKTFVVAVVVAMLAAASANAADEVPTGIDVPGCARYVLVDGKVVQVCRPNPNDVNDPQSEIKGKGEGGGN